MHTRALSLTHTHTYAHTYEHAHDQARAQAYTNPHPTTWDHSEASVIIAPSEPGETFSTPGLTGRGQRQSRSVEYVYMLVSVCVCMQCMRACLCLPARAH